MSECMLEVAEWIFFSLLISGKNRNMLGKIAQWIHKRDRVRKKNQNTVLYFPLTVFSL